MASSWGTSWLTSWLNSWGTVTEFPTVFICDLGATLTSTTITVDIRCHG
jgi:hypothetical protein